MRVSGRSFWASIVALGALASCGQASEPVAVAVTASGGATIVIAEADLPDYRMVAAILTNRDVGDARARIGGKLSRVLVREGDTVRAGQVVAVISDDRISLEAQAGAASVVAAEAAAEKAQQDLARAERLFAGNAIAPAAVEAARSQGKTAAAQLRAARAQAGAAQAVSNQGQVTAPAAGKVTRIPAPQGAVVAPGEVVVAISAGDRVLRIELPEAEVGNLKEGATIRLIADAEGDRVLAATVRQIYPAVASGRVTADLDAQGLDAALVGARVRVLVPAGIRRAIVIPSSYIVTRYGADYVRLGRTGGVVIEAPVQRGAPAPTDAMSDGIEILSGLRAGDQILPADKGP